MGQTPSFHGLLKYVESIVSVVGYENHADFYSKVLQGHGIEMLSLGPIMLSFLLSSVVVIWYAPVLYETYSEKFLVSTFGISCHSFIPVCIFSYVM